MLGFEFSIDTGNHTPVCCKKPYYGPNESKVIMKNILVLESNNFLDRCFSGGWGSPIVLAPKPHQEKVKNIDEFVWRMCVSYRGLNKVTNPFQFPISRCDAVLEDVGDGTGFIYFISLDAAQGYNQIAVRKIDRDKLAFFRPDNFKSTYNVMPFGPVNAPTFYTMVTRVIQDEATQLFRLLCNEQHVDLKSTISKQPPFLMSVLPRTDDYKKSCTEMVLPSLVIDPVYTLPTSQSPLFSSDINVVPVQGGNVTVRQKMRNSNEVHITGSSVIIDDLLLRSTSVPLCLLLLECYFRIYFKYCTTLQLPKCEFFQSRFEFVGHDILSNGNTTAQSKYSTINDWPLPQTGDSLHSFVSLCNFYQKFLPLFEAKAAPLRSLYTRHLH